MRAHALLRQPAGFAPGLTWVTRAGEADRDTGMDFGILKLAAGERRALASAAETAALLLAGEVRFRSALGERPARRASLFDDEPVALHVAGGDELEVVAGDGAAELAIVRAANPRRFAPRLFDAGSLAALEHRGHGELDDTAHRIVRTLFDDRNRPESNLVLGEVVNFAGRWSSYPPHHHPQPEIYHYRFSAPQGYGHAELGEEVFKVRSFDTLKILERADHPQAAAPGYAMYYLWAIRHLEGARYAAPEFTAEHRWVLDAGRGGEP